MILLATTNRGKIREFKEILGEEFEVIVPKERIEVVEDGKTYEENAFIKARRYFEVYKIPTVSEDSGLEVRGLGWKPGVFSNRFFGEGLSDREKCLKLLEMLKDKEDEERIARFVCCIAYFDGKNPRFFKGDVFGYITREMRGERGFGYDPIFFYPDFGGTFAEIGEKKNLVSHRRRALEKLKEFLKGA